MPKLSSTSRTVFLTAATVLATVLVTALALWFFQRGGDGPTRTRVRLANTVRQPVAAYEIELVSPSTGDLLQSRLCLLDGRHGLVLQGGEVFNRCSHVDFDGYKAGSFTAGIQGGEDGQVIDLGPVAALEGSVGGPPLEVLRWHEDALISEGGEYLVADELDPGTGSRVQDWISEVLGAPELASRGREAKHAQVRPDHVYFVWIQDRHSSEEVVALMHVLELDLGERVKLRCVLL